MSHILEVKNLSFSYDAKNNILDNINFKIEKGSIVAILGKNGSGKSTLLDCLIGYNEIKNGEIIIDNINLNEYSQNDLAKKVAYIQQNVNINIDYSVYDFISFGRNPYKNIFTELNSEDDKIIIESAEICNIKHLLNKSITKLSGGERQLVFICRALVQQSDILIFDEPTASLDFGNQYKFFEIIKSLQQNGKTIIFTTHNPNQVLEFNIDVIVICDKKILDLGKAKDVINPELLKKIYGLDFKYNGFNYSFFNKGQKI